MTIDSQSKPNKMIHLYRTKAKTIRTEAARWLVPRQKPSGACCGCGVDGFGIWSCKRFNLMFIEFVFVEKELFTIIIVPNLAFKFFRRNHFGRALI